MALIYVLPPENCQSKILGTNSLFLFCRHTELFRSCTVTADVDAKKFMKVLQQKGHFALPKMLVHIEDVTECLPETWKVWLVYKIFMIVSLPNSLSSVIKLSSIIKYSWLLFLNNTVVVLRRLWFVCCK